MSKDKIESENQITFDGKQLEKIVSDAVAKGVKKRDNRHFLFQLILLIILCVLIAVLVYPAYRSIKDKLKFNTESLGSASDRDTVMDDNGIFGYEAADFGEVIITKSTKEQKLIVLTKEVSVPASMKQAGFMDLGVFSKSQSETIYGTGEYVVDLSKITQDDIKLDKDNFTVTVSVPYPELNAESISMDPSKTVIGDEEKGLLALGDIKLSAEEEKAFQVDAKNKLQERLCESDCFDEASQYAKLNIEELLQPVVDTVSPAYKVKIVVKGPSSN
jgi:hypothetical protein